MSPLAILAWFFVVVAANPDEGTRLVGPFESREVCDEIEEWYESNGWQTEDCDLMHIEIEYGADDKEV